MAKIYGITMGDPNGVGPEILVRAAAAGELSAPFVVYGESAIIEHAIARFGLPLTCAPCARPSEYQPGVVNVIDHHALALSGLRIGQVDAAAGAAARQYVVSATRAALAGEIAAIVTLPVNKEAVQLTDPHFTGHTELIGDLCGSPDVTIMLASQQLIVSHVSTHCSLRDAITQVAQPRIRRIIELTVEMVRRLRPDPRIAVAGLNPHAGENGAFGAEEIEQIAPAVAWARAQGWPVDGPFPPDTVFYMAVARKQFDAVVCMYHDQGHIPLKLLDFEGGVNVTLGLPILRTSVDHGTAFDIAWQGKAQTRSLREAFQLAMALSPETRD